MAESPQDRGRAFEREFAKVVGAEQVSRSGAGVYKLDVGARSLLWSNKHTDAESFRVTADMVRELREATTGIGGVGQSVTPLLAVRFAPAFYVGVGDLGDIINLFKTEAQLIPPTKDEMRRARAARPGVFRD